MTEQSKPATPQLGTCNLENRPHEHGRTPSGSRSHCVNWKPVETAAQEKAELCPPHVFIHKSRFSTHRQCANCDLSEIYVLGHDAVADDQKESVPAMPFTNGWDRYWASLDKDSQDRLAYSGGLDSAKAWFVIGAVWGGAAPTDRTDATKEIQRERAINVLNELGLALDEGRIQLLADIFKVWEGVRAEGASAPQPDETRFAEFDDDDHPFRQWWKEHGQYMMSGGGRRESIWAARGWIAREQMACGVEVTGETEARASAPQSVQPDRKKNDAG